MTAQDRIRARVRALMELRGLQQIDVARALGYQQASVSRLLAGKQSFQIEDFDTLAALFHVTVPELFFDEYGRWDRRHSLDRRSGQDRRGRKHETGRYPIESDNVGRMNLEFDDVE